MGKMLFTHLIKWNNAMFVVLAYEQEKKNNVQTND